MENNANLSNVERQRQILAQIEQRQRINVAQICELFQVSEATARRDLEQLAEQGKVQRVHGGAIALQSAPPEMPVNDRTREQRDEKQRIGIATAALIRDGETIFISSGTTALEVARCLKGRQNLTVITNSLPVITTLAGAPGVSLISLGGMLRVSEQSFIGHIAEQSLAEVRADKVIFGVRAVHEEQGLTNDYLPETRTDRAILKIGREVIVVADHTKMGRVSTAFVAPITAMHTLVTDKNTPAAFVETLRERGVDVIVA